MKGYLIQILLMFSLFPLFGSPGWDPTASAQQYRRVADSSEILATVNGEKITRGMVEVRLDQAVSMNPKAYEKMDEKQRRAMMLNTLNRLIEKQIILQEAAKEGIQVSEEELNRSQEGLRRQFPSEKELQEVLRKAKTSIEMNRQDNRDYIMMRKLEAKMTKQIVISENDIENYWEQTRPSLTRDMVKAKHILVKTEKEAEEIRKKLRKGEKFDALAKQYSQDTGTKDRGGDLGWMSKEMMVKEFSETAFSLKAGEISQPVKTQFGYHLILVEGKKSKDEQTLEDHREHIQNNLQQERWINTQQKEWEASLKAKAKIWNKLLTPSDAK